MIVRCNNVSFYFIREVVNSRDALKPRYYLTRKCLHSNCLFYNRNSFKLIGSESETASMLINLVNPCNMMLLIFYILIQNNTFINKTCSCMTFDNKDCVVFEKLSIKTVVIQRPWESESTSCSQCCNLFLYILLNYNYRVLKKLNLYTS